MFSNSTLGGGCVKAGVPAGGDHVLFEGSADFQGLSSEADAAGAGAANRWMVAAMTAGWVQVVWPMGIKPRRPSGCLSDYLDGDGLAFDQAAQAAELIEHRW